MSADPACTTPRWRRAHDRKGYWYILPALLLFALMIIYPIARAFYLSFFDYTVLDPGSSRFVGMDNYISLFTMASLRRPILNTLYFTLLFVPPYVFLALVIAVLLHRVKRGVVFLRTMIFIPIVVSLSVSAVMFTLFYNPAFGMGQKLLEAFVSMANYPILAGLYLAASWAVAAGLRRLIVRRGNHQGAFWQTLVGGAGAAVAGWLIAFLAGGPELLKAPLAFMGRLPAVTQPVLAGIAAPPQGMLGNADWAMIAVVILCLWNGIGFNVILFLVGLQRIPDVLNEAAAVDGAGPWQKFWKVTWPQLRPTTFLVFLLSMIGAFKIFGQPFIMTAGQPEDSTLTYVMQLYNLAWNFGKFQLGYASAMAYALAAFTFTLSLLVRKLDRPVE